MQGFDVMGLLKEYDDNKRQEAEAKPEPKTPAGGDGGSGQGASRAEEIVDNNIGDAAAEKQIRDAARAPEADSEKEKLLERAAGRKPENDGLKIDAPEYQQRAVAMMLNSTNLKNAQAVIAISNRENIRKGLGKDPGIQKQKAALRGQMSTVAVPTALLRFVQQEVGPLSVKASQNDCMAGFLYWYFGKPDGVAFASPDSSARVEEIVSNLDLNASPAKFNRVNYNMSSSLLERLDEIRDRLDAVASWMQADMKDGLKNRVQADKAYIALCYLILSQSALAPPLRPDQEAGDIDLLAAGSVWDLMGGIDAAYEYYSAKNGREIYKAKHGARPGVFKYSTGSGSGAYNSGGDGLYSGDSDTGAGSGEELRRRPVPVLEPEPEETDDGDGYEGDDDEGYEYVDPSEFEGLDLYAGMYGDTAELQRPDDEVQASDRSATDLLTSMKKDAASKRNLEEFRKKLPKRDDVDPNLMGD